VDTDRAINLRTLSNDFLDARKILQRDGYTKRTPDSVRSHERQYGVEVSGEFGKIDMAV